MKGSLLDIAGLMVGVFVIVIATFVIYSVHTTTNQALGNLTVASGANATVMNQIISDSDTSQNIILSAIPLVTIALGLGSLVLAYFSPGAPIFFFLSFLFIVIYEILAAIFANILYDFVTSSLFINTANSFPLVVLVIEKLPWIVGVFWFLMVIVLYANPQSQSNQSGWG